MATNRPTRPPTLQHWRRRTKSKSSSLPQNTYKHLFEFISTTNGLLGNNNEEPILTDGKSFLKASHDSRVNTHCRTDPKSTASKWAAGSVRSGLIPSLSNHFRTLKAHLKVKRTMWLIRSNTWVGNAKLKQWGKSNTSACPHCTPRPGQTTYDDATHVAGACSHPYLHNLMTCRHDRGTHLMYDAITKAHHECDTWQVNVHAGRRYQIRREAKAHHARLGHSQL